MRDFLRYSCLRHPSPHLGTQAVIAQLVVLAEHGLLAMECDPTHRAVTLIDLSDGRRDAFYLNDAGRALLDELFAGGVDGGPVTRRTVDRLEIANLRGRLEARTLNRMADEGLVKNAYPGWTGKVAQLLPVPVFGIGVSGGSPVAAVIVAVGAFAGLYVVMRIVGRCHQFTAEGRKAARRARDTLEAELCRSPRPEFLSEVIGFGFDPRGRHDHPFWLRAGARDGDAVGDLFATLGSDRSSV
jgi:hypothetical protein